MLAYTAFIYCIVNVLLNHNKMIEVLMYMHRIGTIRLAVSPSPRPWIDVFASPEKFNMAVTESDPDAKVRKMSITF